MWGSQGWNQWALQPAMFNDVPHEQIDWAELAKQWIQMQQTQPSDAGPPPPQVPPPVSLPPPPGHGPLIPEEIADRNNPPLLKTPTVPGHMPELFHSERPFEPEAASYISKVPDVHFWNKPQWNAPSDVDERLWNAPAIEQAAPLMAGKETFDYGHVHDNAPLSMQTIDYNHMSDYPYNQIYTPSVPPPPIPESQYDQYWSQVNAAPTIAPIFLKKERTSSNLQVEEDSTSIDAAKRKQLPAWIRDGLEKMEQERLKRLEKERNAKEHAEKLSKAEFLKNELNLNSSSVAFVPKSKFESDSEGEQSEEPSVKRSSPIIKRAASPIEDTRTEEEKKQDLMLKVRRTLTEVLLSVTNSEMIAIAQEVYKKAKSKAPARQLASSTSLSSVASGLRGLASYDSGSEPSEVDERKDSSDSEEELHRKIKEKKKLFAIKEKRILAEIERKELEDKTDKEKMNNGNSEIPKDDRHSEEIEEIKKESNSENKISPVIPFQRSANSSDIPFISEAVESKQINNTVVKPTQKQSESNSSGSSSSSDSDSDSNEVNKKKSSKESKKERNRSSKRDKSPTKRNRHHKHSKNRDSDSSEKYKRGRSPDRSERKSSNKKRKKTKRSDSSSSSSSVSRKKKSSSKRDSNHNHSRERRSRSYDDRRYRGSKSPSKSYRKSDSHSHRSSHSHRYRDDKYDKKYREERRHRDSRRSTSPHAHTSKLPRKYRTSRSLSSETETSGKKAKKSRNH